MRNSENLLPVAAVLAAVALWGSSFAAMKIAVGALEPVTVMWARMACAMLVVLPLWRQVRLDRYRKGDWKHLLLISLFMPCLYFLLESNALRFTTSSQAGIISASMPLMTALGARVVLREHLSPRGFAGLLLALVSVAWLTLSGAPDLSAPNPLLGNGLEVLAMVCAAGYALSSRHLAGRYSAWTLTAIQTSAGLIFFLPGAPGVAAVASVANPVSMALSLAYLGVFVSLGAFGLFNFGVAKLSASRASAFINLVPVVAVLFGWMLLGERLAPQQWLAAVGVFVGVWLSQTGGPKMKAAENVEADGDSAPERAAMERAAQATEAA